MLESVLFLDIETSSSEKILDMGLVRGKVEYHGIDRARVTEILSKASFIIGHNIINHDLPILVSHFSSDHFIDKIAIDTLRWSPILFADRPYHKLVKGYKIINETETSNPLSDCKLCRDLFKDELSAFKQLDDRFKRVLYSLLKDDTAYSGLFAYLGYSADPITVKDILDLLQGQVCASLDISMIIRDNPVELSYALALALTSNNRSTLSSWVLYEFPESQSVLDKLKFNNCQNPECLFCANQLDPTTALNEFFGYKEFRKFDYDDEVSLQERTVRAGLSAESFVAVFPTGGGKSLTFQLPALMRGVQTRQLTVVISPLVSLMKDQVDVLELRFGIQKAVAINGLLSPLERGEAIERVSSGEASLLYISPESLRSPTITRLLQDRSIARFVIDEAHCFSSWGQDFRVDYLFIGDFIEQLQRNRSGNYQIPVSCFTATAKPKVIEDIKNYFAERLNLQLTEYVTRAPRSNLEYEVLKALDQVEKDRMLIDLLDECEKPTIVYCSRTKKVEEVQSFLEKNKISSTFFHGKLDKEIKIQSQNKFMKDEVDVIVATSAFGMGVDKEDIKTVIHYDISDSLENYIQEAGRAGRKDTIEAKCYILFNEDDLNKHFALVQQTKINKKEIQQIWQTIKRLTQFRDKVSKSALQIAKEAGWDTEMRDLTNKVTASISALEQQGFLTRTQNSPRVFASSLLVRNLESALRTVKVDQSLTEKQRERCARLLQRLIKEDECRVDYLADTLDLKISEVQETITNLRQIGLLGDARDLTAFIDTRSSKKGSRKVLAKYKQVEKELIKLFSERIKKYSPRELNQKLLDLGVITSSIDAIKSIISYWDRRNFVTKKRIDREKDIYSISIPHFDKLKSDIERRHALATECFIVLEQSQNEHVKDHKRKEELPVEFSLLDMTKACAQQIHEPWMTVKEAERALLYLNHIKCIQLEGGFMVVYNKLNLSDVDRSKKTFTNENYENLGVHYENKIQQIHMVGEYARKRIANYEEALTYIDDYFSLSLDEFRDKYFFRRGQEISRPLTKKKFTEIIGNLNTEQTNVVQSKEKNILVLAGPGSGKTKVLVHKIASLLMLEDIKPEQFLMLTFSKAASLEFKSRVNKLVPEFNGLIKIATFHGFCFELLGQLGDLKKSQNVIADCLDAIRNDDIDLSLVANKSVLLIDEFQDVNAIEWELIRKILDIAGDIRVIGVGDDDQNIYSFRGSSNDYMKSFKDDLDAKVFNLSLNYRSAKELVDFNSKILANLPHRMKQGSFLESAAAKSKGKIKVVQHASKKFYKALVQDVVSSADEGTTAVLTRNNNEAVLLSSMLKSEGFPVRLLVSIDGVKLRSLVEINYFEQELKKYSKHTGLINYADWEESKKALQKKYGKSKQFELCSELIYRFEKTHREPYEWTEWLDFAGQMRSEDIIKHKRGEVFLTTLHKSKGQEFDLVYLYLSDYNFRITEELRLLYVACTRAKRELIIHYNGSYFERFHQPGLKQETDSTQYELPDKVELLLTHKDVQLSSQKYFSSARIISDLIPGDDLVPSEVDFDGQLADGLGTENGNVLLYSRKFIDKSYKPLIDRGYSVQEGEVEYKVNWFDKENEENVVIVLPSISFTRTKED